MLVNEYRLEIQFKKVQKIQNIIILITFQWSGPDHWNVSLRRTYALCIIITTGLFHTSNNSLLKICQMVDIKMVSFQTTNLIPEDEFIS